jgi:glycosyltransferase involved in cell wall biosynthesis
VGRNQKILLIANTDWYLYNFRLSLAKMLRDEGFEVVLVSPPGGFSKFFQAEDFRWLSVPMSRRGIFPLSEYKTYKHLRSIYRQENPTLVHHHTIKPNIYGTLAARAVDVPAIVDSVTGLGYVFINQGAAGKILSKIIKPIYRYCINSYNVHVIFENSGDYEFFIQERLASAKHSTIIEGVGVNLDLYRPSKEPDGMPIVMLVGRMLWDKGVGEFVESARIIKNRGGEARFVLVGGPDPGNPSTISLNQLEKWSQSGVVEWWGFQENMPEIIQKSHIIVLPSIAEGAPTVLLEASASGRPIIASDIPGCGDIVKDGETGFLVEVRNVESLADKIEILLGNKRLREMMGKAGRVWMEQQFNEDLINRRTLEIYRNALSGKS